METNLNNNLTDFLSPVVWLERRKRIGAKNELITSTERNFKSVGETEKNIYEKRPKKNGQKKKWNEKEK